MGSIKEALTFDDVTLAPKYSEILPSEVDTTTVLSKTLILKIPLLSSAMDTVTESKMAIAIAEKGGIGIIHRNLSIDKQILEIKKVKSKNLIVGAAVGTAPNEIKRAEAIIKEKVNLLVVDTAHGHTKKVADIIRIINKKRLKQTTLCAGNVATGEAARFLIKLGVDVIKVGIGPGSICTTRLVAGIGVPQLSAIMNVKKAIKNKKTKVISDGGIKFSGDIAKALAAGADAVMIGSLFAGSIEAPGKLIKKDGQYYKKFRGMGSVGAMNQGSADRYSQKINKDTSKYVAEGVEGLVKFKGSIRSIIYQLIGGLRSSMGYLGSKTIINLSKKPNFIKITKAGFYESMIHNVEHVKKDNNY
ncbi:MAG: guanosine monophosphate reductase [Candidatus Pelagibacter sp. TMED64]|nr:guanosine monophosphate reductase [Candidatus Pelagibacter sp.]OUU67903.1 MAG: guanosine monophosphate reductase [Candidatus Pelagibacter sp. TMED64]